ncbi:MAG: AAA family ATPase [Lachnospiraceae bacterium]|nr:AAA family ATPase [Lachnospiraceae bacterium]
MAEWMKLPVGIEEFEKIRRNGFYYVDKTGLIEELLKQWGEVNLFTRPRRFGKSLHMSMLKSFFSIGSDPGLFDGLKITQDTKLCEEYMGQFPVISISLKGVNAANFQDAFRFLIRIINAEARRLWVLLDGEKLDCIDRKILEDLLDRRMEMDTLVYSLRELSEILERYYGKKVIILIDEYDVPLAKANENGYYDEMVLLIRNLFENALKTNSSLKFAVLTGCLRVAKESIFTGLNHFKIYPITKAVFDEYFGFTDDEVREMLRYYGMEADYETVKEWYDGYRFGKVDVYCPWDVINYCSDHIDDPKLLPQNYWLNTSSNEVIHRFIDSAGKLGRLTRAELERLVNGETVQKEIGQELTYKELYTSMDNLWSTLFMTGYLTQRGEPVGNLYNLAVPNQEIRNIITEHILKSFKEDIGKDGEMVTAFCTALAEGKPDVVEGLFTGYMEKTISVRDTFVRRAIRENFYHGILLGILSYKEDWIVRSNRESGDGFSDILITIDGTDTGIVIEVKYAEDGSEEKECRDALKQIADKRYEASFRQEGVHKIINYGIACNKKKCRVMMEKHD